MLASLMVACQPTTKAPSTIRLGTAEWQAKLDGTAGAELVVACADIKQVTPIPLRPDSVSFELSVPPCEQANLRLSARTSEGVLAYRGVVSTPLPAGQTTDVTFAMYRFGEATFVLPEQPCDLRISDDAGDSIAVTSATATFEARAGSYVARCFSGADSIAEAAFVIDAGVRKSVVVVTPSAAALVLGQPSLSIAEGNSVELSVALNRAPLGTVEVGVSSALQRLTFDPPTLLFSADNWFAPQAVRVVLSNNDLVDTLLATDLLVRVTNSSDPDFAQLGASVPVSFIDDDFVGVRVSGLLRTSERLGPDNTSALLVSLGSIPTANVVVTFASSNSEEVSVSPSTLEFAAGQPPTAQVLTLTGVDDSNNDGDSIASVSMQLTTTDPAYAVAQISPLLVANWDDEVASPEITNVTPNSPSVSQAFVIQGVSEPLGRVELYEGDCLSGSMVGSSTVDITGVFSLAVVAPANITTGFAVRAFSNHDYQSETCSSVLYTHDSIAPAVVASLATNPVSPSASTSISVTGTGGEPGALVRIFADPTCSGSDVGSGTVEGNGTFTVPVTVGLGSTTSFRARQRDLAGNVSNCSSVSIAYVQDSGVTMAVMSGVPSLGSMTSLQLQVQTEPSSQVQCYIGSGCLGSVTGAAVTADAGGVALCNVAIAPVIDGSYTFSASVVDLASNTTCSNDLTYRLDTTAPSSVAYDSVSANGESLTLTWFAATDPSSFTYEVAVCEGSSCNLLAATPVTNLPSSLFTYSFTGLAACSEHRIGVRARDELGNVSSYSDTSLLTGIAGPQNVRAVPRYGHVELTWDPVPNASDYSVTVSDTAEQQVGGTLVATEHGLVVPYEQSAAIPVEARYRVFARANGGTCSSPVPAPLIVPQANMPRSAPVYAEDPAVGGTKYGRKVALLGDVTGDGVGEVAIAAPGAGLGAGLVEVLDGRALFGGSKVVVRALTPQSGDTEFGGAMAVVPDQTGDGVAELLIGAPGADGAAYLVDVAAERTLWRMGGQPASNEHFGFAVSRAPDGTDVDTVADLAIGAPNSSTGRVVLVTSFDASTNVLNGESIGDQFGSDITSGSATPSDWLFVGAPGRNSQAGRVYAAAGPLFGTPQTIDGSAGDRLGESISYVGDMLGDGSPVLAIGVAATSTIYLKRASVLTTAVDDITLGTSCGFAMAPAGDLDSNGTADLWVGCPAENSSVGRVRAIGYHEGALAVLDSFVGVGVGLMGTAIDGGVDLDGDGKTETLVGRPDLNLSAGSFALHSVNVLPRFSRSMAFDPRGKDGFALSRLPSVRPSTTVNVAALQVTGTGLFTIPTAFSFGSIATFSGAYLVGNTAPRVDRLMLQDDSFRSADTQFQAFAIENHITTVNNVALPVSQTGITLAPMHRKQGQAVYAIGLPNSGTDQGEVRLVSSGGSTVLSRAGVAAARLGKSVAAIGDVNNDRVQDLLVSGSASGTGYTEVLSGVDLSVLHTYTGSATENLGTAVVGLPDLNGDGFAEYAISAPNAAGGGTARGRIDIMGGGTSLPGSVLFSIVGSTDNELLGQRLAYLGRAAASGHRYLVASSQISTSGAVRAFDLDASGASAWTTPGLNAGDEFGFAIATGIDANNDGLRDLLVGAPSFDVGGADRGRLHVLNGGTGAIMSSVSGDPGSKLGTSIAVLGDVDRDLAPDWVVGAPAAGSGQLRIQFCQDASCSTIAERHVMTGPPGNGMYGQAVICPGDLNGDGRVDLVTSVPSFDHGNSTFGRVDVYNTPAVGSVSRAVPLSVTATSNSADIAFTSSATSYWVEVRPLGGTFGPPVSGTSPVTVSSLLGKTRYEARVWAAAGNGASVVSASVYFSTQ